MWKKVFKIHFLSLVKVIFWFGCAARNWNPGSYLIFRAYVVLGNVANGYVLPKNMTLVIELILVKFWIFGHWTEFEKRNQFYFVTKIVLTYCEKKLFYWSRKILKFEAEGWEFAKVLRSLVQFILNSERSRTICGNWMLF